MSDPGMINRSGKGRELRPRTLSIYTLATCPFCLRAKEMLDKAGVKYKEYSLKKGDETLRWVIEQSGGRKVFPQLFVDDRHLGGFYELKRHCEDGTLHLALGPV